MKLQSLFLRTSLLVFVTLLFFGAPHVAAQSNAQSASTAQASQVPARITQAIDETQLVRLKGNVHPLARAEFDQGAVPDSTPMNRMLLLLQRSPEQEAALQKLMEEQQSKDSPNFHNWLTPQQFGAQFGPADADIQTVTDWLTRHGFQRLKVSAGRTVIEFSGTVGQVRNAFHTEIHRYLVNGEMRQANSVEPQIPAALTPVVAGTVTLHNFPRESFQRTSGPFTRTADGRIVPDFTTSSGFYIVGPADFAKIYNLPNGLNGTPPTPPGLLDGTGVTVALVADSNINPQDVIDFRNLFGLPANFTPANIILDGPDPGLNGDESEADLDAQIAGMVAPAATVNLVVSEGTLTAEGPDLSALYIVDNNIADVMSESFGACEALLGANENLFLKVLWEQAAAQGISVMVAAGDNGAAGCDDFTSQSTATLGLAVSGVASTPFTVAVGGTDFDDAGTQTNFWSSTNATGTRESALGYIHEIPWNDSCAAGATSTNLNTVCASANNISAGSGGPSSVYPKPAWQTGGITPADSRRDLPDVSLFSSIGSASNSSYLLCEADAIPPGNPPSCVPGPSGFSFFRIGGTSASSPAFAAVMALIVQQQGARQGNPNPVLYKIASTAANSCNSTTQPLSPPATCVLYDVTKGNNSVPCTGGTPNCSSTNANTKGVLVDPAHTTTPAWTTGTGYDMATGLGSVNVTNLAAAWKTAAGAFKGSTTTTKVNNGTTTVTITHGASVTLSAAVASATTGTPTGDVSFLAPTSVNGGIGSATLSGGTASLTTTFLPGGSYNVKAHYTGDGTFSPSDDPTGVPVVVNKEASNLQVGIVTFNPSTGTIASTNATTFAYGSPYIFRMDILNSTGTTTNCQPLSPISPPPTSGCALDATGTITLTDNGSPLDGGTFAVNAQGSAEDQPIQLTGGTHTLAATYSGDISYNPVSTAVTDMVAVTPASTSASMAASPNPVPANQQVTLSVTLSSQSNSLQGPTGTVTFKDGGTTIGTAGVTPVAASSTAFAGGTASMTATFSTTGAHSLTAVYGGDQNYATSTSSAFTLTVGQTSTTTLMASPTSLPAGGGSVTLTATVVGTGTGASPTGTVQFKNGAAALGATATCTPVSGAASPTCTATLTTTLTFLAPPIVPQRIPTLRVPWTLLVGVALVLLLLFNLKRVPARYRRVYAGAALLLLAVLVVGGLASCSGGYGGGGGVHYDYVTAVYSGDSTYAGSTSSSVTITIQ